MKSLNNNRGQSLLLGALMLSMLLTMAVAALQNLVGNQNTATARTSNLMNGITAMESFATLVQHGYDLWMQDSTCPGMKVVTPTGSAVSFCIPTTKMCFNGYCVDPTFYMTENTSYGPTLNANLTTGSKLKFFAANVWNDLQESFDQNARAQRVVQRQAIPKAIPKNGIGTINCPGDPLCRACNGVSLNCLTLRVCPKIASSCSADQYWMQRFGVRL